jgi:hypothetical protein
MLHIILLATLPLGLAKDNCDGESCLHTLRYDKPIKEVSSQGVKAA